MQHHSGVGYARTNGTHQLSFPRLAEGSSGPPAEDSSSIDSGEAAEGQTACGGSRHEGKEAKKERYRLLFREICSHFTTTNWDKRRCTYASLVALQGCATEEGDELVRTVLNESQDKDHPLAWFSFTVLERMKEHDLWSRDLCYWFNKQKQRFDSLQSFESMFGL